MAAGPAPYAAEVWPPSRRSTCMYLALPVSAPLGAVPVSHAPHSQLSAGGEGADECYGRADAFACRFRCDLEFRPTGCPTHKR